MPYTKYIILSQNLGIIISSDLDWSDHFQYISSQAYKTFGLLRRTFCNCNSIHAKKLLYLSLVRPKFIYCSCVWHPHLIKDIVSLEKVQRRATKFILNDFSSDYKSTLLRLNLFRLMLLYEYYDIIFFFKCLKSPSSSFNINNYVSFASSSTRSSANAKLLHTKSTTNSSRHFYFNRLPVFGTLSLFSPWNNRLKENLKIILWNHFITHFDPDSPCSFHFVCPCISCTALSLHHNFTQAV